MIRQRLLNVLVRTLYGAVLFMIVLATLEGLADFCEEVCKLPKHPFHIIAGVLAFVVAVVEGFSMKGLERLKEWLTIPEYLPDVIPDSKPECRWAHPEEIAQIHQLARATYGYGYRFSLEQLRGWWTRNNQCFFVMLHNNVVFGYIDAFPISAADYEHLLHGKDERRINPQNTNDADGSSSFYIASIVIKRGYSGNFLRFLMKALQNYETAYARKPWRRICTMAITDRGKMLANDRGFSKAEGRTDMWYIDRAMLPKLTEKNRRLWGPLLPGESKTP